MARTTHLLLLLGLPLLSHAEANRQPTSRGVRWLQKERSVIVRLETPDLPLWNQDEQIGEDIPSALIFNFTLSHDNLTLLLNDAPILPLENAHVPPRLYAHQTGPSSAEFEHGNITEFSSSPLFALDYLRKVPHPEDGNQLIYNYNPTVNLDILGAGIAGYNALLPSGDQRFIRVNLHQRGHPSTAPIPSVSFKIVDVRLEDRDRYNKFTTPDSLKQCTIWSWLCGDMGRFPWYQYVYRRDFDEYGKIGSLRHLIYSRWASLLQRLGVWKAVVLIFVLVSMVLSPVIYGIFGVWKRAQELHRKKLEEVDSWTADEEIEGLLDAEDEEDCYGEIGDEEVLEKAEESGGDRSEKPLPPPPFPPRAGDTSDS